MKTTTVPFFARTSSSGVVLRSVPEDRTSAAGVITNDFGSLVCPPYAPPCGPKYLMTTAYRGHSVKSLLASPYV